MFDWLAHLFSTDGFPARWYCGAAWADEPGWAWLHIASDLATWGAYTAIPIVLWYFVRHRRDIPFQRVFLLFGAFILACGTVHLIEAILFWHPVYRLSALVKLATAVVSWGTIIALVRVVPAALVLRSPADLEREVAERTAELHALTEQLAQEVERRKTTSRTLQASEERLRLALEAGGMGTWDWDLASDQVTYNQTELELTQFDRYDGTRTGQEFVEHIHGKDRERVRAALQATIDRDEPYEIEFRFRRADGKIRWFFGRGAVLRDDDNRPERFTGVNFDITQRRRVENALRLRDRALNSATNGVIICNSAAKGNLIVYANPGFEELTGYAVEDVMGKNCRFLQGPDTDPAAISQLREAIAAERECRVTLLNYRKDGTPFWNELYVAPVENEQGAITEFVGVQNDVTDRVRYQERLQAAQQQADGANRAKSEFLASVSHEIRTPLSAILGCAETLVSRVPDDGPRQLAEMVRNQGQLLQGILNDILDLSKIEAGKLEIRLKPCSIVAILADVCSLLEASARERRLTLSTEFESHLPPSIETDPLRLRQILLNLVSNAIKYTDQGGVVIAIRCEAASKPASLVIDVRDTGIGIPLQMQQTIFEPFTQDDSQGERWQTGTGLGLTICRRLVTMLGGQISLVSQPGEGSTFTVSLPIGAVTSDELVPADQVGRSERTQPGRTSVEQLAGCRVLVAEDSRSLQFMIEHMLKPVVAEVRIVENGQLAVEEIERAGSAGEPYHVLLMDMQMPVMNGFQATARLRELGSQIPIVALTAGAMAGDAERCFAAGCSDYLAKPFDYEQLLAVIATFYREQATG